MPPNLHELDGGLERLLKILNVVRVRREDLIRFLMERRQS